MSFMITCPICGRRDAYEFRFGGEDCGPRPDETDLTTDRWLDYVHLRTSGGDTTTRDVVCGLRFGEIL